MIDSFAGGVHYCLRIRLAFLNRNKHGPYQTLANMDVSKGPTRYGGDGGHKEGYTRISKN